MNFRAPSWYKFIVNLDGNKVNNQFFKASWIPKISAIFFSLTFVLFLQFQTKDVRTILAVCLRNKNMPVLEKIVRGVKQELTDAITAWKLTRSEPESQIANIKRRVGARFFTAAWHIKVLHAESKSCSLLVIRRHADLSGTGVRTI